MGLETLYWQPFVDQWITKDGIDRSRVIPICRSGTHHWYGCPTGIEVFAMRDVQALRVENKIRIAQTKMLKQQTVTPFDRAIWADTAQTLGLKQYHTLHPAWMYQTLKPFWEAQRGILWLDDAVRYAPLPIPPMAIKLPERFIAVKFYARPTWPPNSTTASLAREAITQMARSHPVVLLTSDLVVDDHVDFQPQQLPPNVYRLSDLVPMEPQTSLAVVSHVMARSMAFVGTYGGLGHLALRYGKPSLNLYTEWSGAAVPHRHLSEALALRMGVPFIVMRLADVAMVQDCLPRMEITGTAD